MGGTDTLIKRKADQMDMIARIAQFCVSKLLPMLFIGAVGGGAATGAVAIATPNIPVPNGVATETGMHQIATGLKEELRSQAQSNAVYQAGNDANMRAIMSRLDKIENRLDRQPKD